MTYEAVGTVQMNFLRILSEEARQNFTYSCINSVAWYNSKLDSYDMSIKLMSANEMELGYDTTSPAINVLVDGCRVRIKSVRKVWDVSLCNVSLSVGQEQERNGV